MESDRTPISPAFEERAVLASAAVLLVATVTVECVAPAIRVGGNAGGLVGLLPWLAWAGVHSAHVRGGSQTVRLFLIAAVVSIGFEAMRFHALDLRAAPALSDLVLRACADVLYLYAGFSVALALTAPGQTWWGALGFAAAAALVVTALGLTVDPVRLRVGAAAYSHGGAFMPEIRGVNGHSGVPLADYAGWLGSAALTYVLFWLAGPHTVVAPNRGRVAAVLCYVGLYLASAIPALRLGYPQLLLIGGVPVGLVALFAVQRLVIERHLRQLQLRRGTARARVAHLDEHRLVARRS